MISIYQNFSVDWYKDRLTDEQLDELEHPKVTTAKPEKKKTSSRRRPMRPVRPPPTEEDE